MLFEKESLILLGHIVRFINRTKSHFDKTKIVNLVFVEQEPYSAIWIITV